MLRNSDTSFVQQDMFVYYERRTSAVAAEHPTNPQLILGTTGTDTLVGGVAGDILVAAAGNMTMTGGGGADIFAFDVRGVTAVIGDFVVGLDKIEFDEVGVTNLHQISVKAVTGGTLITGGGETITLSGVAPCKLTASDFILKI